MPDACEDDLVFVAGGTGVRVMVLGLALGKAGGQTGEGLRGNRGRCEVGGAFPDRRNPRSSGPAALPPDGRAEAADGRGRRLCVWRDATSRSSGPYADPWAERAGGSGA